VSGALHWVSRFETLAMGLLWWNPLFWLIRARIHHYAELSCDAWALWAYPADRRAFAEALIDAQEKSAIAPVALRGLCATHTEFKDFERRLNMIMKQEASRGIPKVAAALAILATLLVLPGATDDGQKKHSEEKCAQAPSGTCIGELVEAKKLYGQAEKLFAAKDWNRAVEVYQKVLELEPKNGMAHSRLGYMLTGLGHYDRARKHFEVEIALGHNPETATYNLACASALSGDGKAALGHLQRSVRRGFVNAKLMQSDTDLASIRESEAFEKSLELCQKSAALRQKLDQAKKSGDQGASLEIHDALCRIASEDGVLLNRYGLLLLQSGKTEVAADAFRRQAESGYNAPNACYNLACALSLSGDQEGAIQSLERSVKLGMSYAGVLEDKDLEGLWGDPRFEKLKEMLAAPERMQKEIEKDIQAGDLAAAVVNLEELAERPASSGKLRGWAHFRRGELLLKLDRPQESIQSLEHALQSSTDTRSSRPPSAWPRRTPSWGSGRRRWCTSATPSTWASPIPSSWARS